MGWHESERAFEHPVIGTSTLPSMFEASAERHPGRPAQRYKGDIHPRSMVPAAYPAAPAGEFTTLSYRELRDVVRRLATGFRELGVRPDDRVGIIAETRLEWAQVDLALLAAGATVVTVYPDATEGRIRTILEDADAVGVVAGTPAQVKRVLDAGTDLGWIVSMDELDGTAGRDPGPTPAVHTLGAVHDMGASSFHADRYEGWLTERSPSDLATLLWTSGTTGRPKGVPLTHRHLRSNVNQVWRRLGPRPDRDPALPCIDHRTRLVSFLPLAHVFERLAGHFLLFAAGASVAYAEGPSTLREDFVAVSPTMVTAVPRVYERLEASIRSKAEASAVGAALFRRAVAAGRRTLEAEDPSPATRLERAVLDRLVLRRVRAALGGEVELMISGGGRLSPALCRRFHAMGLPILEGYGLTETSPVVAVNPPEAPVIGTVGPPVPDCEVRLDTDVGQDGDGHDVGRAGPVGELLVRGPNVVDGYWRRPAATARAFTPEGWFRTGDLFERREDGYLAFVERRKAMIVLSTGKNVAPGPIEAAIEADALVEQCLVTGDGRRFVAALIVPNHEAVVAWADRAGVDLPAEPSRRYRDDRVVERFDRLVRDVNADLEPHETVKRFRLVPGAFTRENGLLTPTMKKRRRSIEARFEDAVADMYEGVARP